VTLNVTAPPDMPCERIVVKPPASPREAPEKPAFPWGVQLIGDRSEIKALATYRALQKKHDILGDYQPTIVRTTLKTTAAAIWTRIRIEADSRQAPRPFALACARSAKLVLCSVTEPQVHHSSLARRGHRVALRSEATIGHAAPPTVTGLLQFLRPLWARNHLQRHAYPNARKPWLNSDSIVIATTKGTSMGVKNKLP
jgi:hypothetical protein